VNPRAEVRVSAGREGHLRALGALALWPANSLFVEGYLTTRGDAVSDTYRMIEDAGFGWRAGTTRCAPPRPA
jgi:biotin synthase